MIPFLRTLAASALRKERAFCFDGNARVISALTDRETSWPVGGVVHASSRSAARAVAREAARAQANLSGKVLGVAVHIID